MSTAGLTATKWTVQPATRTPACRACFWAFTPLNDGSREGWMLSSFPVRATVNKHLPVPTSRWKPRVQSCVYAPFHFLTKVPVRILMNPARHTSSTPNSSSTRSMVPSNSARLPYSLWSTTWLDTQIHKLSSHNALFDCDYYYYYYYNSYIITRVWMPASDALFRP